MFKFWINKNPNGTGPRRAVDSEEPQAAYGPMDSSSVDRRLVGDLTGVSGCFPAASAPGACRAAWALAVTGHKWG